MGTAADFSEAIDGRGRRIALLVSRFNEAVTSELERGAVAALIEHGVGADDIDVLRVPGAWELPQTASRVVRGGRHDAVVALGCVVRGETPHFDYVAGEAQRGLGAVALEAGIPVVFGVLTTDDQDQAWERAARDRGDKGGAAALTALEMIQLFASLG